MAGKGDAMKTGARIVAAVAMCAVLSACAAPRSATKAEEPPGLSVRLPIATATTLNIESEPGQQKPELPLSVVDESRGRWLTLFELNYSPAKPPPPVSEEEP
jgi:hypothetical protein